MKQKSSLLKALSIMLLFVLFATQARAQGITVTGTVNDNLGPVIGASVVVKGTVNGCITDLDGNFKLTKCTFKRYFSCIFCRLPDTRDCCQQSNKTHYQFKGRCPTTG